MHSGPHIKLSKKSREPLIDNLASILVPYAQGDAKEGFYESAYAAMY